MCQKILTYLESPFEEELDSQNKSKKSMAHFLFDIIYNIQRSCCLEVKVRPHSLDKWMMNHGLFQ